MGDKNQEGEPQAPAGAASPAETLSRSDTAAGKAAGPRPKPSFHIYSRQKDQHVVGPGCWCLPKVTIVDGQKIVVHKRD